MTIMLSIAVLLLTAMTMLPRSRSSRWWIRVLDFPRFQLLIASLVLLTLLLWFLEPFSALTATLVALTFGCGIYQGYWILPYTRLSSKEVGWANTDKVGESVRLVCANVLTPNRNAEELIRIIGNCSPDIILTLESDQWWQDKLAQLESAFPHTIQCPLDNLYGMHLYSKFPLIDGQIQYLLDEEFPSIHCKIKLESGRLVRCHFLHPAPPVPEFSDDSSQRDAELIVVAKGVATETMPVIVAGDLNDVAWSETTRLFRKISGLLDPRVGRGLINTFHANYWFLRWPLDHLFHSRHFTVADIRRLPKFGSDHFALLTELVLEPDANSKNEAGLSNSDEDEAHAGKIMEGQKVQVDDVPN